MVQSKVSDEWDEFEKLQQRIRVGVGDVSFETREMRLVIVSIINYEYSYLGKERCIYLLEIEIVNAEFAILDLHIAVHYWHVGFHTGIQGYIRQSFCYITHAPPVTMIVLRFSCSLT